MKKIYKLTIVIAGSQRTLAIKADSLSEAVRIAEDYYGGVKTVTIQSIDFIGSLINET